jgi:predicted transcriptional regulator
LIPEEMELMTLKEIAEKAGLNYHTARKYGLALQERGIDLSEEVIPILQKIASLTGEGLTVEKAIDSLLSKPLEKKEQDFSEILLRLEAKIDSLEKENRAQKELIQVYLSKIDSLQESIKALPPPKTDYFSKFKDWIKKLTDSFRLK